MLSTSIANGKNIQKKFLKIKEKATGQIIRAASFKDGSSSLKLGKLEETRRSFS